MIKTVWVGIDWGTHSSKWWYTCEDENGGLTEPRRVGPVIDSTLHRRGGNVMLVRERTAIESDFPTSRIKRCLIEYPLGPSFWEAKWEDSTGLSLGEAATVSLAVILRDALDNMQSNGLEVASGRTNVRLCFSLPNWVGEEQKEVKARRQIFQACAVVAGLLEDGGLGSLPRVGIEVPIEAWHERTSRLRRTPECQSLFEQFPTTFRDLVERNFSLTNRGSVVWRLAAESCGAGFPQLERLLIDPLEARKTEDHWVKLLVVDVGAGSTDIGYMISSRNRQSQLFFNYLKPAPTLEWAGEKLTEMVRDYYRSKKGREVPLDEAEILKLNAPDEWKNEEFVRDWIKRIANRVADYISSVRDTARLPEPAIPGLKIVLTGGSGAVPGLGLGAEVLNGAKEGLSRRGGVPTNVIGRTQTVEGKLDWPQDPIDQARRAVSIGAGKKTFGELRYREKFEKEEKTRML